LAFGNHSEGDEQGEDLDELDFAFGKYKVPKKLAEDVRGLQKAFTEKTQTFSKQVRELEAKATELGIRFDGRTKDKKLGQLIQDRLSAPTGE
jgi:hypothetical protein